MLHRVDQNRWRLALADSAVGRWARGLAANSGLEVTVRYIWAMAGELGGIPVLIRRSAWLEEVMESREAQAGSARAVHITDLGCPFS